MMSRSHRHPLLFRLLLLLGERERVDISWCIQKQHTVKKRERTNPPERERERVPLLCYVFTLFLMCACINIGRRLSSCAFVFLTPFSSRGDFCLFFRSSFFLSFAFKNLVFSFFLFTHNRQFTFRHIYIQTHLPTYSFFLSFFVCASTCEDSFFYREIETFSGSR